MNSVIRKLHETEGVDAFLPLWSSRPDLNDPYHIDTPVYLAFCYGDQTERLRLYGLGVKLDDKPLPMRPVRQRKRLLIVMADWCASVWRVCLHGTLAHIDKEQFEVCLMLTGYRLTYWRFIAEGLADIVYPYPGNLEAVVSKIRTIAPDIIFYPELALDAMAYLLASTRLAPLQVTSWGHPITSGAKEIDLFFSGELIEPPGSEAHYTERLVKLPGTGGLIIETVGLRRPQLTLPKTCVRFLIAQTASKLHPQDDELYIRIAQALTRVNIPCEFWVRNDCDVINARLSAAFEAAGFKAPFFFDELLKADFIGLMDALDIYLDCPSFSGYNTAFYAVQTGIPIVTLEGEFMRQRLAAGLLRQIGVTETIAGTREDYVHKAVTLAKHPELRAVIRARILARKDRAHGSVEVVRAFESALLAFLK